MYSFNKVLQLLRDQLADFMRKQYLNYANQLIIPRLKNVDISYLLVNITHSCNIPVN
jgi:hypothetical protein